LPLNRLIVCAFFTALIAILAQIAVPVPFSPVPLTGQVIGVFLAGLLLGPRAGALTVAAYLFLGASGAPVFSFARGGLYMITGPTGGYLWGFIPAVIATGLILERIKKPQLLGSFAALLPALGIIYFCGALQLGFIMQYNIPQVVVVGVLPFLPFDLLKAGLTAYLSIQIKKSLHQNRLTNVLK